MNRTVCTFAGAQNESQSAFYSLRYPHSLQAEHSQRARFVEETGEQNSREQRTFMNFHYAKQEFYSCLKTNLIIAFLNISDRF